MLIMVLIIKKLIALIYLCHNIDEIFQNEIYTENFHYNNNLIIIFIVCLHSILTSNPQNYKTRCKVK